VIFRKVKAKEMGKMSQPESTEASLAALEEGRGIFPQQSSDDAAPKSPVEVIQIRAQDERDKEGLVVGVIKDGAHLGRFRSRVEATDRRTRSAPPTSPPPHFEKYARANKRLVYIPCDGFARGWSCCAGADVVVEERERVGRSS
jgi:hypothetical protein